MDYEHENADVVAERAVLGGIYQYGSDAYIDVSDILNNQTFTVDSHAIIYKLFEYGLKDKTDAKLDMATVFAAAKDLGLTSIIEKPEERKLLRGIMNFQIESNNVRMMAGRLRKLEITRLLRKQLDKANKSLKDVTGEEPISQILGLAENVIFDFTSLLNDGCDGPKLMGSGLDKYIEHLEANPVTSVGISTGMPAYDRAIGGGVRMKTVNVIAARPKAGKTMMADNIGIYMASRGTPVLNLDTEMTHEDHWHRILANLSGVEIDDIENGQYSQNPVKKAAVRGAAAKLQALPYHYISIAGQPFEDTLATMRRWRKKIGDVPAVIIFDYMKLMSAEGISKDMKEYQLLGFMMTGLHNFMVKYDVGCISLMQLNRDGIEKEDTSTASGSDRIIWLCSNFSIYKKKSAVEQAEEMGAGLTKAGNRKLVPVVSRHGAGLEDDDYICIQSEYQLGRIKELGTRKELEAKAQGNNNNGSIQTDDSGANPSF